MSLWGYRAFENDDAGDWIADFLEDPRLSTIQTTARQILKRNLYLDVTDCCECIAAAAVLCELFGKGRYKAGLDQTDTLKLRSELSRQTPSEIQEMFAHFRIAINKVSTDKQNSELLQMWQNEKDYPKWIQFLAELSKDLNVSFNEIEALAKASTGHERKPLQKTKRRKES